MSSVLTVHTPAELAAQAKQETQAAQAAQIGPLESQVTREQGREGAAVAGIGSMFDKLQPGVDEQANLVQSSYDASNAASRSIFEAANQRMAQLRQDRAAEAQM